MKKVALALLASLCGSVNAASLPKNIIMVVGDGMGPEYTTAYRMFKDDASTPEVETTIFDQLLVGMASTHPVHTQGYVTDSAAGATALSAGVKTYNGAIGVDADKQAVQTVLEFAKSRGMKTGVAVTSQINHATPAGFSAHNESRNNYNQIADSYFEQRINGQFTLDVMLGGGWQYFIRAERNLVKEFQANGYQYVDNYAALSSVTKEQPLLGLFADKGLPWALDDKDPARLTTLVKTAVNQLANPKGFFLLVEGSQIDWGGHANDIAGAMGEMDDLAKALEFLSAYVDAHPDTLIVVTADHSTGGMTIGASGKYDWQPEWLHHIKASPATIAKRLVNAAEPLTVANQLLGFELNADEQAQLKAVAPSDEKAYYATINRIIDKRTYTGWTTKGHTGLDVQVFAKGPSSELFKGHLDNTQIAQTVFKLMGKP